MSLTKKRSLDVWIETLPSQGRYSFTRSEAMNKYGLQQKAFNRMAGRLSAAKRIARIHGEFYIVVPLEYTATGIVPADWFIVDLMKHLKISFYVGVLSAAEYHGAAHQRSQIYQVVTNRPLRMIACRGVGIHFFVKRSLEKVPVQKIKGVSGYIPISTPEVTALDLLRYYRQAGGLDNVLTVLQELGEVINPSRLVEAAEADNNLAYVQRLGWLMGKTDFNNKTALLAVWLKRRKPLPAKLDPSLPLRGSRRDKLWNLWINIDVEGDLS